jgi:hypothetical protein
VGGGSYIGYGGVRIGLEKALGRLLKHWLSFNAKVNEIRVASWQRPRDIYATSADTYP